MLFFFRTKMLSIRFVLGALLIFCVFITAIIAISLQGYFAKESGLAHAVGHYQNIASHLSKELEQRNKLAIQTVQHVAHLMRLTEGKLDNEKLLSAFAKHLQLNRDLQTIIIANDQDESWQLIHLNSPFIQQRLGAQADEKWLIVTHSQQGQRIRQATFYNHLFEMQRISQSNTSFRPTLRNWYVGAQAETVFESPPYLFETLKVEGETFSLRLPEHKLVVAVDMVLERVTQELDDFIEGEQAFIYRSNGRLITSNQTQNLQALPKSIDFQLTPEQRALVTHSPLLKVSNQDDWAPFDYSIGGTPQGINTDLFGLISQMTGLKFTYVNGRGWAGLLDDYRQGALDILQPIIEKEAIGLKGLESQSPLLSAQLGVLVSQEITEQQLLELLRSQQIGILDGWSITQSLQEQFGYQLVEIQSFDHGLQAIASGQLKGLLDLKLILEHKVNERFIEDMRILDVTHVLAEQQFHYVMQDSATNRQLMALIDQALQAIPTEQLDFIYNKWLNKTTEALNAYVPYPQLVDLTKQQGFQTKAHLINLDDQENYLFINPIGSHPQEFLAVIVPKAQLMSKVYESIGYALQATGLILLLLLPLTWFIAEPLVQSIHKLRQQVRLIQKRRYSDVQPIKTYVEELSLLSDTLVESAKQLKAYAQTQEQFFDAMIQLIARAIDDKSPYTAGHCYRVPEIALLLADAMEQSEQFDFKFANDAERREFKIAAWLHDCGKITTPEYVVDKGSKLETNYNRIHEIRTRFEVLWRDAQIHWLLAQFPELEQQIEQAPELKQQLQQLQADFSFIANANIGGEFMSEQDIAHVQQLAQKKWQRNFDAGLGLSPLEQMRYQTKPTPMMEALLADHPEQVIPRERPLMLDPKYNIKVQVPENLYNLGEIYNLSIQRGTLTFEERFKINEHMISAIKMLDNIPFPEELARVPRYASTHHEKMNGQGYPRGLTAAALSIPERILMVADVFEALTAGDRPYKKAKSLTATFDILVNMARDQHLDPEIIQLLLQSGVYLKYANQHLTPEQIETIDVDKYLAQLSEISVKNGRDNC